MHHSTPLSFNALLDLRALDLPSKIRTRQYDIPQLSGRCFSDILTAAEQELSACTNEITRLQCLLIDLRHNRDELQELVKMSRSLSAPARRLPPEVLGVIFMHSASKDIVSPNSEKTEPLDLSALRLGWICSPWREAAMSCSPIWSHLTVVLSAGGTNDHIMLEAITELLSRSKECSITITLIINFSRYTPVAADHPVLVKLSQSSYRWHHLSIKATDVIMSSMSEWDLDDLRSLQVSVQSSSASPPSLDTFSSCSKLSKVVFYNGWPSIALPVNLKEITMTSSSSSLNAIALAPSYTQLTDLVLRGHGDGQLGVDDNLSFPSLLSLKVILNRRSNGLPLLSSILSTFTTPSLAVLDLSEDSTYTGERREHSDVLVAFIDRSQCKLQTLRLTGVYELLASLTTILRAVPSVTSLHLGELTNRQFITTALLSTALTVAPPFLEAPLLPRLDTLGLWLRGPRDTDAINAMARTITSRWRATPISSGMVSCLCSVDIVGTKDYITVLQEVESIQSIIWAGLNISFRHWAGS